MILKVSYIFLATDKSKSIVDGNYTKILLDENNKIPSIIVEDTEQMDSRCILNFLINTYIKYDYDFVIKQLGDVFMSKNCIEVAYISTLPYSHGFNKLGNVYGIKDLHINNIDIEDKYAEIITKFGSSSFR